jgi:hypothetical protein
MTEQKKTYATHIQWRLRRTIIEDCYVSVPVTSEVMDFDESGKHRLNVGKVRAAALAIGDLSECWAVEQSDIDVHPIQRPRPESVEVVYGWPAIDGGYILDDHTMCGLPHAEPEPGT